MVTKAIKKQLVTLCAPPTVPTPIKRTPLLSGHLDDRGLIESAAVVHKQAKRNSSNRHQLHNSPNLMSNSNFDISK